MFELLILEGLVRVETVCFAWYIVRLLRRSLAARERVAALELERADRERQAQGHPS